MPELPEVETVCRGLAPAMVGATIEKVELRRKNLRFPFPDKFAQRLQGKTVHSLKRRAKYAVADVGQDHLIMHLGMSGRFRIEGNDAGKSAKKDDEPAGQFVHETAILPQHDHVVFHMSNGRRIIYNDARRFGYMILIEENGLETHKLFANLGVEPLGNGFNAQHLAKMAIGKTTDMKSFLMDQRHVAGLGNIYVCEALFRSGISPKRQVRFLVNARGAPTERAERLTEAIRKVLADAIEAGGSTLRDHRQADGSLGYFQHSFTVYGREGEPCSVCGAKIRRFVKSSRSTFHCPRCQR